VFVHTNVLQMRVVEQLFGVDINGRLTLAFTTKTPFWIDESPELGSCKRPTNTHAVVRLFTKLCMSSYVKSMVFAKYVKLKVNFEIYIADPKATTCI